MKHILITGCSTGIGYATALRLKKQGHQVYVTARQDQDLSRLSGQGLFATYMDYADPSSVDQAFDAVLKASGNQLDALFHNGAYGQPGALEDLSRSALEAQFATNVFGWHQLTVKALAHFRKQNRGIIIYNSSVLGLVALKNRGAYNASKFAIEGLCDTLRLELQDTPIDIVLIQPGPIESAFRENAYKAFQANIDVHNSPHQKVYAQQIKRFESNKPDPFTLKSEDVAKVIERILKTKKPKPRYYITVPTYCLGYLKRLLSTRLLDKILVRL